MEKLKSTVYSKPSIAATSLYLLEELSSFCWRYPGLFTNLHSMFRGQIVSPFMHVLFQEPQENKKPSVTAYLAVQLFAYQVKHFTEKPFTLI